MISSTIVDASTEPLRSRALKVGSALAITSLACCQAAATAPQPPSVPLPQGMTGLVVSEETSMHATRRMQAWFPHDEEDCGSGAHQGIQLVADVTPRPGRETILASYSGGVVVLDREGQLIASSLGYPCTGSADEIEAVAVGDAFGDRTLVIVATAGGHQERSTFISLFRLGLGESLDPVFTAVVEEHKGSLVQRGTIHMLPGALAYRLPDGRYGFFVFDPIAREYLDRRDPLDEHGHEPPAETSSADLDAM
jgi:hypothetical protein